MHYYGMILYYLFAGLWTVCFNNFTDIHRFYDYRFHGCMWVFEEEYYIIHDYLLPGFYIAVQFFFTLTFTLLLVSSLLIVGLFLFARDDDRYVVVLLSTGAAQVAGGNFMHFFSDFSNAFILIQCFSNIFSDLWINCGDYIRCKRRWT